VLGAMYGPPRKKRPSPREKKGTREDPVWATIIEQAVSLPTANKGGGVGGGGVGKEKDVVSSAVTRGGKLR